jgi:hypothetical protein
VSAESQTNEVDPQVFVIGEIKMAHPPRTMTQQGKTNEKVSARNSSHGCICYIRNG